MSAVNVGIGHDNDAMIAQFFNIKLFVDIRAQSDNQIFDFIVGQHFVQARSFHI